MQTRTFLKVSASLLLLAGCVAPLGPTVQVNPPGNKSLELFTQEKNYCMQYASQQTEAARTQVNNQMAGAVLLNVALGASQAAAAGGDSGSVAANAASSGLAAANANVPGAQAATVALQQQYDAAYSQCMVSKGNLVPGYSQPVAAPAPPRRRVHRPRQRSSPSAATSSQAPTPEFVEPAPAQ